MNFHDRIEGVSYKLAGAAFGLDASFTDDPTIDEERMSVWIPYSSGVKRDSVGDLLEVGGIRTERHQLSPTVLFDHGKQIALPIAMAEDPETREYTNVIDVANQTAKVNAFFYRGDGTLGRDRGEEYDHALFCEQLFDLIAKRYIRAGSIGYQVIKAMPLPPDPSTGTPQGLHLLSVLMLEASAVVMPANMDTVRKALSLPTVCGKALSPVLVKSLAPYAGEKKAQLGYEGPVEPTKDIKELRGKYKGVRQGQKIKVGDRVEGAYMPWSDGGGPISGTITQIEMEQGAPRGMSSTYGRAYLKLDKPLMRYGSPTNTLIITIGPDGRVDDDKYELKGLNGTASVPLAKLPEGQVPHSRWKPGAGAIKGAGPKSKAVSNDEIARMVRDRTEKENAEKRRLQQEAEKREQQRRLTNQLLGKKSNIKDLRGKYRRAKGHMVRRKKGSPGVGIVHVSRKDVQCVAALADRWGLKMERMGSGKGQDSEKLRLTGPDEAIENIAAKYGTRTGSKSMAGKTKEFSGKVKAAGEPDRIVEDRGVISIQDSRGNIIKKFRTRQEAEAAWDKYEQTGKWKFLNGNANMSKTLKGRVKANEPADLETQEPEEMPEEELTSEEKDFGEGEPDEKYSAQVLRHLHEETGRLLADLDELAGPLEHEAISQYVVKKCEALVADLEELEALFSKHHPDAKQLAGDEAEPGPDDATPADSEEEEEPTPEEAIEGMETKRLRRQLTKALGAKYGKKGKKGYKVGDTFYERNNPEHGTWVIADVEPPSPDFPSGKITLRGNSGRISSSGTELERFYVRGRSPSGKSMCPECGKADCTCNKVKDLTEDEVDDIKDDLDNEMADTEDDKSMKALEANDFSVVGGCKDFLSQVGNMQDHEWSDDHRMEAYHQHKSMAGLAGTAVGTAVGGPVGGAVGGAIGEVVAGDKELPEDEFKKDYREEGLDGEQLTEEVNEEDSMKSMHPHRKACSVAAAGLKDLSGVKPGEFNEEHRQKSMEWHKALDDIKPEESLDEAESEVDNAGDPEMGEMDEKSGSNEIRGRNQDAQRRAMYAEGPDPGKSIKSLKQRFAKQTDSLNKLAQLQKELVATLR